jgi:galactose-1-phosphate uridylyltransferase
MNTYRFNPVFNQWVLLGSPVASTIEVTERHLLDVGRGSGFVAATLPRQPFIVDPPKARKDDDFLYQPQPPVGEAEVFLYEDEAAFFEWSPAEWGAWIRFVGMRLRQVYHNPHLHFVSLTLSTGALASAGPAYQRVGDLAATSHPIAGAPAVLNEVLLGKLLKVEDAFIVQANDAAVVYVPSAPLNDKEAWVLPTHPVASFEKITATDALGLSETLASLFGALKDAYPEERWLMTVHTTLDGMSEDATWWIQVHAREHEMSAPLMVRPLPEAFARYLENEIIRLKRR